MLLLETGSKEMLETGSKEIEDTDILLVCRENTAGVMSSLTDSINRYTDYKARFIQLNDTWLQYPKDLQFGKDNDKLPALLKSASAIHWNIFSPAWFSLKVFDFRPYLQGKIQTRHFHGTVLRERGKLPKEDNKYKRIFVSTPDLLNYVDNAIYLPNPIYIPFKVKTAFPNTKCVLHMPTKDITIGEYSSIIKNSALYPTDYPKDSHLRGTDIFVKAMKRIIEEGYSVNYGIVKYVPFKKSIEFKAICSMQYGQMYLGIYGVGDIEAMALGKPVITRISEEARRYYIEWAGEEPPILLIEPKTFKADMQKYLGLDEKEVGKEVKKWVEKANSPREIAKRFVEEVYQ